jgi:O-succinylhomoserine sulfhydrylase
MSTDPRFHPAWRPSTVLVHGGQTRSQFGETAEALYLTSGFVYDSAEQAEATFAGTEQHFQYSRFGNPTIAMLESRLAAIEGAEACRCTATGMAAVHAALASHLKAGDRVVASRALFGSCHWIVSTLLPRYGIESVFVDGFDLDQWREALSVPTAAVLLESPSNPMLEIVDLPAVSELAHQAGAIVVVDNVFATPLLQKPLALGADVVVYSCTKHIDGQGRVLGGAILGRAKWVEETLQPFIRNTGPSISAFNAWLLLKGLETLPLRLDAGCRSAERIAQFLAGRPGVSRVWYPTRTDHAQHELAMKQMSAGGTLVVFEVEGGKAGAFAVMNAFRLIAVSNNLGDSKSLATHPATTTHMKIGPEERARLGISDGVIRLSVGLEDVADIEDDLARSLEALTLRTAAE